MSRHIQDYRLRVRTAAAHQATQLALARLARLFRRGDAAARRALGVNRRARRTVALRRQARRARRAAPQTPRGDA